MWCKRGNCFCASHNLRSWLRSYLSFHWQLSFFIRTTTPKSIVMFIKRESVCAPLPYVLNYIRAVKNYGCCIGNIRFLLLLILHLENDEELLGTPYDVTAGNSHLPHMLHTTCILWRDVNHDDRGHDDRRYGWCLPITVILTSVIRTLLWLADICFLV